jgi:hypothetical protein
VTGISNENAVILINDIFQGPGLNSDYTLSENLGITSISFTGTATSVSYDVNNASIPRGGIIVSVGSTGGFGYQPLSFCRGNCYSFYCRVLFQQLVLEIVVLDIDLEYKPV